ncbi:MAG TPA: type II secretion system F family protein [Bacillota bacterium]|nr:type II secretion system F family protein [Bacillota bacterium]HQB81173.1 type II secretion system F family protein [Bacillota bacterium]
MNKGKEGVFGRIPKSRRRKERQLSRHRWLSTIRWVLLSVIPARLALIAFLGDTPSCWFVTAAGALLLGIGLARLFHRREERMLLTQYLHLLGYLSTRLSAGIPLEAAFSESARPLSGQLGRNNLIVRSLFRMRKNLEAQMSLNEALSVFTGQVGLPVCKRDFTMLIMLAQTGGRVDIFIRQSHQDLAAQINAQSEVSNERRGHSSEALILAVIPFFMARFVLSNTSTYSQPIHESPALMLPLKLLYLVAMFALFILLLLLAPEKTKIKKKRQNKAGSGKLPASRKPAAAKWLSRLYLDWLPGQIGMSVASAVLLLSGHPEYAWPSYLARKRLDLASGLFLAALFALSGRISWFLILLTPFAFSTLRDLITVGQAARQKEQFRFFYPSVVNSLHILMESGLTLDRSLRMVAHVNIAGAHPDNPVALSLAQAALLLETGYDSVMAADQLAERCPLPEVQAALRLMARYEREGGGEILELIRMQSDRSRQLYRDALRGRAEQRSLLYVIPMAIDLIVVMVTVILPALVSMRSFL